ncbi:restriction endonuclease subunit S [Methanobrevibacter smithii]|uniref:restriction endonuclease subunit S n=2 Tax=Methanobrevibacter smithii TaxID=2173 RepID=UPI0037DDD7E0
MRFSGFDDEWKTYKLKDLLHNKSSSISINQLDDNVGNYPLYGASGFLKCIDFYEMDSDYISIVKDGSGVGNISFHEKNTSVVNTSQYILPKENLNIHFIFYLLQTINLNKYKTGSTIPHIYFKDYSIEKVKIPKYDEQKKIGILLKNLDAKIEILDNKLQMCQNFKKYLMQQIFTQKLRFDFSDEWNYVNFNNIFKSASTKKYQIKSAEIMANGDFEVIDQGKDEIAGYFNDKNKLCYELPIIIYGDHTTFVKFRDKPFIVGADGVKLLLPKIDSNLKYLFYALEYFNIKPEGYKRHFSIIKKIKLPIPSLEEQNEISEMFSSVDNKLKYTQKQLQETKKFKKGLLQQMFVVQLILSLLQNKKHI